jgi:hypothetical protein
MGTLPSYIKFSTKVQYTNRGEKSQLRYLYNIIRFQFSYGFYSAFSAAAQLAQLVCLDHYQIYVFLLALNVHHSTCAACLLGPINTPTVNSLS